MSQNKKSMKNSQEIKEDSLVEPNTKPVPAVRQKCPVILILLLVLLLCVTSAAAYVLVRLNRLEQTRQAADALKAQGEYARALTVYAQLMEDDPLSFTSLGNAYVCAGADGVVACADALLETDQGARYLTENRVLEEALAHAAHPAVPASFAPSLSRRSLLCQAILAEEAGELTKALELLNEAGLRKELSYPLEQQAILAEALQARQEGRYADALEILSRSMPVPELAAEIQQQIIDEQDAQITAAARAALSEMDLDAALTMLQGLSREEDRLALEQAFTTAWTDKLTTLHAQFGDRLWAGAWYTLALGEEPQLTGDKRYDGLDLASLREGSVAGGAFALLQLNNGHVRLLGDTLGAGKTAAEINDATGAALGLNHGLVLHENGTVTNLGARQYGRSAVTEWADIVQVAAGGFHSLGLRADGTVAAAGLDLDGQCQVSDWTNVSSVAAGLRHSVALLKDGRVVATGDNSFGQCNVGSWENIIDIRCGGNFTLGLTADWRLLATGDNSCGQCNVADWKEVVAFDGGLWHTVALLSNGRIVTAGANGHDQGALTGAAIFRSKPGEDMPAVPGTAEPEYVYSGNPYNGPWLYLSGDGCVIAAFDTDSGKINATRADLICTYGHPPAGILAGVDVPKGFPRPLYPVQLARQNQAAFAITGDYFTFGYNADGLKIRRGRVFQEEKEEMGFSFFPDGSMRIVDPNVTTAQDLLSQGIRDCWVFGPTLIQNGEALDIHTHPLSYNDVTMRTVVASICPYHHVAAAYGSSTLAQVTADLLNYGCEIAYNLDGGRSCMMVFMGKVINRSSYISNGSWRALPDMVGFLTSEKVPKP